MEFDGEAWLAFSPEAFPTRVQPPTEKRLGGFDVVNFTAHTSPECSGLCCSGLAKELPVNEHCLFPTFKDAEAAVGSGAFNQSEPGPYRIFAVYSVNW